MSPTLTWMAGPCSTPSASASIRNRTVPPGDRPAGADTGCAVGHGSGEPGDCDGRHSHPCRSVQDAAGEFRCRHWEEPALGAEWRKAPNAVVEILQDRFPFLRTALDRLRTVARFDCPFPAIACVHGAGIRTARKRESGLNEKRRRASSFGCCLRTPADPCKKLYLVHRGEVPRHRPPKCSRHRGQKVARGPAALPGNHAGKDSMASAVPIRGSSPVPACLPEMRAGRPAGRVQRSIPPSLDLNDLLSLKP